MRWFGIISNRSQLFFPPSETHGQENDCNIMVWHWHRKTCRSVVTNNSAQVLERTGPKKRAEGGGRVTKSQVRRVVSWTATFQILYTVLIILHCGTRKLTRTQKSEKRPRASKRERAVSLLSHNYRNEFIKNQEYFDLQKDIGALSYPVLFMGRKWEESTPKKKKKKYNNIMIIKKN